MNQNQRLRTRRRLVLLKNLLRGAGQMLIVLQDNPDPDAIASAVALRHLVHSLSGVNCSLGHGGDVGRAENRALVRYLGLNLRRMSDLDLNDYDRIALVDTQPGAGNNSLPPDREVHIVLDHHHPIRPASRRAALMDIRCRYGATATIVWEYLRLARLKPDVALATVIMYAIRSDTHDLGMEASRADIEASQILYPLANKRMLSTIQRGRVDRGYFRVLAAGLQRARVYGPCILSNLGSVTNCDMIGEVADLLLRDEQTSWSLCYGFCRDRMILSVRTSQTRRRADELMQQLVGSKGSGGGHELMAGGQIRLRSSTAAGRRLLERMVRQRWLRIVGVRNPRGRKLITQAPKKAT